jgi:hypothetical protein
MAYALGSGIGVATKAAYARKIRNYGSRKFFGPPFPGTQAVTAVEGTMPFGPVKKAC